MSRPPTEIQRYELEGVLFAYCDLVDRARIDELADLFTDDAVVDYGYDRIMTGRTQIVDLLRDRISRYSATSHHCSNVRLEMVTDDSARASSAVYAWHRLAENETAEVWGRYYDVLSWTDGRWRIRERRIRAAGWDGFAVPDGLPGPFQPITREGS